MIAARLARLNVLTNYARDAGRIAAHPIRYCARLNAARGVRPRHDLGLERSLGFALGIATQFNGLAGIVNRLTCYAAATLSNPDLLKNAKEVGAKLYYLNILSHEVMRGMPELARFAVSSDVMRVLAPYFGIMPELSHMALFASGLVRNDEPKGTQRLHWDNHDRHHVKLFCFLDDVGEDDGPLCVLPADKSWWLRKKTGRRFSTSPIDDAEFRRYFSDADLVKITGPRGTVAIVDTSTCLHYGSRTQGGKRLAFVIHYAMFADYSKAVTRPYQDMNMASRPELRPTDLGPYAAAYRIVQ